MSEPTLSGRLRVLILESVVEAFSLSVAGEKIPASVGEALSDFNLPPRSTSHLLDVWGRIHTDLLSERSSDKVDRVRERLKASRRVSGLDHFSGFDAVVADLTSALEASLKKHHVVGDVEEEPEPAKKSRRRKKSSAAAVEVAAPAKKRRGRKMKSKAPKMWQDSYAKQGEGADTVKFEHYIDASNRAVELGIHSSDVYHHGWDGKDGPAGWRGDLRLPSQPKDTYADVWDPNGRWDGFLQRVPLPSPTDEPQGEPRDDLDSQGYYRTWRLAAYAAYAQGVRSKGDYKEYFELDSCLPSNPADYYDEWLTWKQFIEPKYGLMEASQACASLDITDSASYAEKRGASPFLPSPSHLYTVYKGVWPGWKKFLAMGAP